jgi:hypothetical protein
MTAINWSRVNSDLHEAHVEGRHVEILKVQEDCHVAYRQAGYGYHYNVIVDGQCDEAEDTLALAREAVERMAAKWAAPTTS